MADKGLQGAVIAEVPSLLVKLHLHLGLRGEVANLKVSDMYVDKREQ
jgi:hypothetical protein